MPRILNKLRSALGRLGPLKRWLLHDPRSPVILSLLAVALAGLHLWARAGQIYFGTDPLGMPEGGNEAFMVFDYCRKSYYFGLWLQLPVLILVLMRSRWDGPPFKASVIGSAAVFLIWVLSEIATQGSSKLELAGVEPSPLSTVFRLGLTGGLILSPPLLVWLYTRSPLLSQYVLRQFLTPFAYCFIGFIAVWLVFDLSDNGPDFFEANAPFGLVMKFYVVQIPQIVLMILPITLLLALLYSLGKMSKSNEIISMLTAGKSLPKVLAPLFFVGLYSSLITLALNYEWAPEAEGHKDSVRSTMRDDEEKLKRKREYTVRGKHFRNREDQRTWFVGKIPFDLATDKLRNVEIYQGGPNGKPVVAYLADKAAWNHITGDWRLISGNKIYINEEGDVTAQHRFGEELVTGWRETPWKIYSESLVPEQMGVPGLSFHIKTNSDQPAKLLAPYRTHWHYRWALPWSCLAITLVAAPLGIVFSRRGVMGGVAAAILIFFFGIVVFPALFTALGQGMHVPAFLAAWVTNIVLGATGICLLMLRSSNRELPKPSLARLWKWVTGKSSRGGTPSARQSPSASGA